MLILLFILNIMINAISFLLTLFVFLQVSVAQDIEDLFKPKMPIKVDTIYYPFYNGVQMIEVDNLAYWDKKIYYLEQAFPRAMPHSMTEGPPMPNEYLFRDSIGVIIKAFNVRTTLDLLTIAFEKIPINQKSNNFGHQLFPTHASKSFFSEGAWVYSPVPQNFFNGFYKVYDMKNMILAYDELSIYAGNNDAQEKRVGLIDSLGNMQIPMQYQNIYPLNNNLLVQKKDKWGIIDKEENEIIPIEYESYKYEGIDLISFSKNNKVRKHYKIASSELINLKVYDKIINPGYLEQNKITQVVLDGKIGFIDSDYNEIVSPRYDICDSYYACDLKLARVFRDNKWGYINKKAEEVIPCIYEDAENFDYDGHALVQLDGESFCIDTKGRRLDTCDNAYTWNVKNGNIVKRGQLYGLRNQGVVVVPIIYNNIYKIAKESFFRVILRKKQGIFDASGNVLLPCEYDEISSFWTQCNLALVVKDQKTGVINKSLQLIIPCIYDRIQFDLSGYLIFKNDGKYGMMDSLQNIIIPALYNDFRGFRQIRYFKDANSYSLVAKDSLYGYIDLHGREIVPCKFELLEAEINNNRIWFKENHKYGFIDATGTIVIPALYDRVWSFETDITGVEKDGKWAFINKKGKVLSAFIYDLIVGHTWYDGEYVVVRKDEKFGVHNSKGKEVLPCIYDYIYGYSKGTGFSVKMNDKNFYVPVNK